MAEQHVLVVEDSEDSAEMLVLLLEQWDYCATVARDGAEALLAAVQRVPDVVLLDIGLPGMSGYEVARRLRADSRFSSTSLVALTGWSSDEAKLEAQQAGFDELLTKPFEFEELKRVLERCVALRRNQA